MKKASDKLTRFLICCSFLHTDQNCQWVNASEIIKTHSSGTVIYQK